MNKWEKEVAKSLLDSEEAALSELEKQYKRSLKDITEKIKSFQADIDLLDAAMEQGGMDDAAKALMQSKKRSKVYQKQYQEALKAQVSGILEKMQSDQYTTIDGYLRGCYDDAYLGEMYSIAQQGLPVIMPIDQAAAVKAILTDSKISNGLYSALGVYVQGLKKTITQEISRGIASSMTYRDIARNISNVSGSGYTNAKRIVVTEGNRIQNTASRNAAMDAKAHGADLVKMWDSTLDGKTRPSHRAVDGQIREMNERFSNGLDRPGDSSAPAAEVVNCRCKEIHRPRWDIDGGIAKRDNFTGEIRTFDNPKGYAEFKKKYWSKENLDYMQHVSEMEKKYGTKKFETVLDKMTDDEYKRFKELEEKSPLWKTSIEKSGNGGIITPNKNIYGFNDITWNRILDDDIVSNGKPTCNPNYGKDPYYSVNCQRCVQTFEFRRRGYDVVAKPKPKTNNTIIWGSECFTDKNGNPVSYTFGQSAAQVKKELKNAPDGARYGIYIAWKGRNMGAHVFVAEKENGVVRYLDPQVGNLDASSYFSSGKPGRFGFFRMDDKELTKDLSIVSATMEGA